MKISQTTRNRMKQISIFFALVLLCLPFTTNADFLKEAKRKSPLKNKSSASVYELQKTYHKIYEQYRDSVVFISTQRIVKVRYRNPYVHPFFRDFFENELRRMPRTRRFRGLGTGFIISSDGYICTNYHVVKNINSITVIINKRRYRARLVGSDKLLDIALLKIKGRKFKPVYFGNSDKVKIGDLVVAIGNPFGFDKTFTSGIISATGRNLRRSGTTLIQTDTSINKGNSGGPLINLDGEVIAVNSMIYSKTGGNLGIGFAIPINRAVESLIQLKKYGKIKRGYIGVYMGYLSKRYARRKGLRHNYGVLIRRVRRGGPAYKAGIRAGDIILAVNKTRVRRPRHLQIAIMKVKIGRVVKITAWRNGRRVIFWVKIISRS